MRRGTAALIGALIAVSGAAALPARAAVTWSATTGGPLGGTITRMRTVGGQIWATVYSGGIFATGGSSWSQIAIGRGIPENRAADLVVDPTDAATAYVPEMIGCAARTTDGAATWSGLCDRMLEPAGGDNFSANTVALDPASPSTVYVPGHTHTGETMLMVSTDRGETWTKRSTFPQLYDFNHLWFFGERMFLGTRFDGVFVSDDRGATWSAFNTGLASLTTTRFATFGGRLYMTGGLLQYNVRTGGPLYRLNDAGTAWQHVPGPTRVTGLAVSEDATTLWLGGEDDLMWRSADGVTFARYVPTGLSPGWIGEIVADGSTITVGVSNNGAFRSTNGGASFTEFNAGLKAVAMREVFINPANANHIFAGTWDRLGMYVSTNAGSTYRRVAANYNVLTIGVDPRSFSHVYLGGDRFVEATFSGTTPTLTARVRPGPAASVVKAIAVHPTNPAFLLAGIAAETAETQPGYGLYWSADRAKTWKRATGIPNKAVYSIVFNRSAPSTVYASALGGGVYRSTTAGKSWTRIGPSVLKYPYRLAMDPKNARHLIAGTNLFFAGIPAGSYTAPANGGGLWESKDAGATWRNLTESLRSYPPEDDPEPFLGWKYNLGHLPNFEQIVIDPRSGAHIIAGHHGESAVSTPDGGATWRKEGGSMTEGNIHNYGYCMGISASGSTVYGCTCGRGLFKGSVPTATSRIAWEGSSGSRGDVSGGPKTVAEARMLVMTGAYDHAH